MLTVSSVPEGIIMFENGYLKVSAKSLNGRDQKSKPTIRDSNMIEKKRRQGRGKTLKTICTTCRQEYLQSCMGWQTEEGNRRLKRVGQYCPNPSCDYIIKDVVELDDPEE